MEDTHDIIPRPIYTDRIRPYIGTGLIKVLTGQRRVGKSYILKAVAREIAESDPEANIININLEDFAFAHITDAATLHSDIVSRLKEGRRNCIFIDEVQEVDSFDKVVRSLALDPHNDIYLTGSNSKMLSAEIASRLAGRSVRIHVHPLCYQEFLRFHSLDDSDDSLDLYLRYGGLPYLVNLPDKNTWAEYIYGVTDTVVYRDVVSRHSLRNTDFLQRLLMFLADNTGQLFTAKRIADYLKSQRVSSSVSGVLSYVGYVEDAYIINRVNRWDIEGRRLFEVGEKIYFEDCGIRNSIVGYRPDDIGGLMENAVYNHLAVQGYKVKVGVLPQGKEIDFVAEKGNEYRYIQVSVTVAAEETAAREFGNLARIPDNYAKTVVTLRESAPNTKDGIRLQTLRAFLTT